MIGFLEREAGLLNELAEAFLEENVNSAITVIEKTDFLEKSLQNFEEHGFIKMVYSDEPYHKIADILLAPQSNVTFFKKIPFMDKVLHLSFHAFTVFEKHFWYYFENGTFIYDNLTLRLK